MDSFVLEKMATVADEASGYYTQILDTKMEDCNLKRVNFRASAIERVSFLWSNPEEAFFRKEDEES